jgi:inosose dehydratase
VSVQVAAAPVSYGVFEVTVDGDGLPAGETLVATMADEGYAGTELGPPGYLGDGAEVGRLLAAHGLRLVGSFLPLRFSRAEHMDEDLLALDRTLDLLDAAAGGDRRPAVLLSDGFCEPDRVHYAGAIEAHPETWLPPERERLLMDNVHRAAERCRERGFPVAFHYHAGTYVETPREIEAFLEAMDPGLLGLCFDTGHSAFGGGDPLALLREHGDLVTHVHLKDVDLDALAGIHAAGQGLEEAWRAGVFCELGQGQADVDACLAELRARGYDGWIVVEQDRVLAPGQPFADVHAAGARNRAWLRERGL